MKKKLPGGLEIIGDLRTCDQEHLQSLSKERLKKLFSHAITRYGFHELGSFYYQFDIGCTGVIGLSESHITFHTWPEYGYVSINVYTCNYSKDNTQKTKELFRSIAEIFSPKVIEKKEIIRDIV